MICHFNIILAIILKMGIIAKLYSQNENIVVKVLKICILKIGTNNAIYIIMHD